MERVVPAIHGPDHAPGGPDPIPFGNAVYAIEVDENFIPVTVADDQFNWLVPEDLDEALLVKVEAYVNEAASGAVLIQIHNDGTGNDLLSTRISIDAGDLNSKDAATQPVVNAAVAEVSWGDHLRVDVDSSSDAVGLGVVLYFAPASTAGVVIRGAQGDPGGVASWEGSWDGGTTYVVNQSVVNNGTSYVARVDNPTTEPGVDPGWEAEWQVLSARQEFTGLTTFDNNQGRELDIGIKDVVHFPFAATIEEWTLLGDSALGSILVDLWVAPFASYPPTVADSIVAGNGPELITQDHAQDSALTGWSPSIAADDVLVVYVDTVDLHTYFSLNLKLRRT